MRQPNGIRCLAATVLSALLFGFFGSTRLSAQDDGGLQLFGSMQTVFFHQESELRIKDPAIGAELSGTETRNSFAMQQLDLFLRKEMGSDFTAFVDLEFQLNYSSEYGWGSLSLQEAWMNYHLSDAFNVKTGLLFPAFNRLNEIKNRLALLPYLFRPLIYERLLSRKFFAEDFVPEHAFLQLHGSIPIGDFFVDYAAYTGNAESSYITRRDAEGNIDTDINPGFEFLSGVDPTEFKLKLFGGRFGLRTRDESVAFGMSFTHDYNNLRDTTRYPDYILSQSSRQLLGSDAPRIRLGADLSVRHGPLFFETEVIKVIYDYEKAERLQLEIEQSFVHGMVGYDVLPALTAYVSMQWGDYTFGIDSDYYVYSFGGAYRVNDAITAKAQLIMYEEGFKENEDAYADNYSQDVTIKFVFLGFSILL
ncbi:MAG: hypothetical protein RRA94_04930 [Bacteroidota bacterium]|nr:hypothetical protein [Bacteroidota bacterium]